MLALETIGVFVGVGTAMYSDRMFTAVYNRECLELEECLDCYEILEQLEEEALLTEMLLLVLSFYSSAIGIEKSSSSEIIGFALMLLMRRWVPLLISFFLGGWDGNISSTSYWFVVLM